MVRGQRRKRQAPRWDESGVEIIEQVGATSRLVFAANPGDRAQRVTMTFEAPQRLSPAWAGAEAPAVRGRRPRLDLAPYTVQIWEAQCD